MAYLEYFSPSRLLLQEEVALHPELAPHIAQFPASEFELRLAAVAAYCGVIVDGLYDPDEIDRFCEILVVKLQEKRTLILRS